MNTHSGNVDLSSIDLNSQALRLVCLFIHMVVSHLFGSPNTLVVTPTAGQYVKKS